MKNAIIPRNENETVTPSTTAAESTTSHTEEHKCCCGGGKCGYDGHGGCGCCHGKHHK